MEEVFVDASAFINKCFATVGLTGPDDMSMATAYTQASRTRCGASEGRPLINNLRFAVHGDQDVT